MLNLPKNTILGALKLINTFQFYEVPRIFSCKNKSGAQFLVLSTFDDFDIFEWLYLPISNDRLASIVSKRITLREAFELPEDGYLFYVESDFEGEAKVEYKLPEQIESEDLPKQGIFLKTDELFSINFGAIDATEAATASKRETFNLHLYPISDKLPELEIRGLGTTFTSLQDLIDSLGQYCAGKPTSKGAIPSNILENTKFKATQIFNGSFGIQLKSDTSSDLFNNSLAFDALFQLMNLLQVGDNETLISNKLHELKGRVALKYRFFLENLIKLKTPLKVDWGSPNAKRGKTIKLSKETIANAYNTVCKVTTDISEVITFKAQLLGLDVITKHYRVLNLCDNEKYSGKISDESINNVEHSKIKGIYKVTLKKVTETNESSGNERITWILSSLEIIKN